MRRPWSQILAHALELFEGGRRWRRGALYNNYDPGGSHFVGAAKTANNFCAYGAIYKSMIEHGELDHNPFSVRSQEDDDTIITPIESLLTERKRKVVNVNDGATDFSEVKAMFCAGIKRALEQEQRDAHTSMIDNNSTTTMEQNNVKE